MLGMRTGFPFPGRLPCIQWRWHFTRRVARFDPSASALGFFLVRRVADHYRDGGVPFDSVGRFSRFGDRWKQLRHLATVVVWVAQSIGDEQSQEFALTTSRHFHRFGQQPQLRDGIRSKLDLETSDPVQRSMDGAGHRTFTLVVFNLLGNVADHAKQIGARACRRIDQHDRRRGQACRQIERWAA